MAKTCKYQKLQRYVSYDNGATWEAMEEYQRGALIEADSPDCGATPILYRWTEMPSGTSYVCVGYNKYTEEKKQQSTDGGTTWTDVSPLETRSGSTLIERDSIDCGYVEPKACWNWTENRQYGIYHDTGWCASCNSSEVLSKDDMANLYMWWTYSTIYKVVVGSCVTKIERIRPFESETGKIRELILPDTLLEFGPCSCKDSLVGDLTIPSSVTKIGQEAFAANTGLTSITILATTPPELGNFAFDNTNHCPIYVPCESLDTYRHATNWTKYAYRLYGIQPCNEPPFPPSGTTKWSATYANGSTTSAACDTSSTISEGDILAKNGNYDIVSVEIGDCVKFINHDGVSFRTLTSVTIPNSVAAIDIGGFNNCTSLVSVTIPDSVGFIGEYAFYQALNLREVTIGKYIVQIDRGAFSDRCPELTSVTITAAIPPTLGNAVFNSNTTIYVPCESLSLYMNEPSWAPYQAKLRGIPPCSEPSGATKWLATYSGGTTASVPCDSFGSSAITENEILKTNLESVVIGTCVTTIGSQAFYRCSGMTSINIPNSVTSIGDRAFGGCSSLQSIIIPDSVTTIGSSIFSNCGSLTSVTFGSGITRISNYMFSNCTSLSSITIPNGITSIGGNAFEYCTSLTSVTIPNSVISIGNSGFSHCNMLSSVTCLATTPPTWGGAWVFDSSHLTIYVPCGSLAAYQSAWGWSSYASSMVELQCPQYRWYPSGTTCINFDKYQNNIKQESYDSGTTWENVSPEEYSASTVIEYNSEDCGYIPPALNSKWLVTYTGGTTSSANCDSSSAITEDEIPSKYNVTSVQIGDCVTSIGNNAFSLCTDLTSVDIGSGVTSIGYSAFMTCSGLTSIIIPNSVTSIGDSAFYQCSGLTSVNIPSGVTNILNQTFYECKSLTSVTIPNSVTSINEWAFFGCSGLTSVTIGSGVTSIGDAAFYYCRSLTSITILATNPPTLYNSYVFYGSNCPIYVPSGRVQAYKSATNWSSLASRIQAIPNS